MNSTHFKLSWLQTEWHAHTQMLPKYNLSGEVNKYPCYGNNGWTEQNPLGALREQQVVVFRIKKNDFKPFNLFSGEYQWKLVFSFLAGLLNRNKA